MKLNLLMYSDNILGGYTNVDPYPVQSNNEQSFTEEKVQGDVQNLDWLVDDGECDEIIADDILDFVPINKKVEVIQNIARKVKFGGKLTLGGIDSYEVSKAYSLLNINMEEALFLLYGDPNYPFGNRKGCFNLLSVVDMLGQMGFKPLQKRILNYKYSIVAERMMPQS